MVMSLVDRPRSSASIPANRAAKLDPVEALRCEYMRLQIFREVFRMAFDSLRVAQAALLPDHPGHRHRGHDRHRHGLRSSRGSTRASSRELQSAGSDMIIIQQERGHPDGAAERRGADAQGPDLRGRPGRRDADAPLVGAVAVSIYVSVFESQYEIKYQSAKSDTPWSSA
ncbi:MAG: hypothetical protein M0C28_01805 [Candidatus Moduliflexus flocculans]|nr:hypothetical protein [Candidatus Moduliflexus flocculans]